MPGLESQAAGHAGLQLDRFLLEPMFKPRPTKLCRGVTPKSRSAGLTAVQALGLPVNLPWRLRPLVVAPIALSLALLNVKALASELSPANHGEQGESHSELLLKFDDKFKAVVDIAKQSKKANFGPLSVTISYTNSNTVAGVGPASETRQDQAVAFDVADFAKDNGEALPSLFWSLSPSSVYMNSFVKEASHPTLADGLPDRTTGISSGASWTWNGGTAGLTYWNYNLDGHYIGGTYNSAGHGFDAAIAGYRDKSAFYAKLSYHQIEDGSYDQAEAVNRGYDAYLSMSYKPQHLPDIVVDGDIGRYEYTSFGTASEGMYWTATVGIDFSKFIWGPVDNSSSSWREPLSGDLPKTGPAGLKSSVPSAGIVSGLPSAKLVFRYSNQTDHSFGFVRAGGSEFYGMIFRAGLN